MLVNAQAGQENLMRSVGIKNVEAKTNFVRGGTYSAMNAIDVTGGQYDLNVTRRVGDSIGAIFKPIYDKQKAFDKNPIQNEKYEDYYGVFNLYLAHHHNIDRMAQKKPVLGKNVTSDVSKKEIELLDEKYPEFKKIAEKVWKYNDNLLQIQVDGGLILEETAEHYRKMYPHYVPTYREGETSPRKNAIFGKNSLKLNVNTKSAVGSGMRLLPIDEQMAKQTLQVYPTARLNHLLSEIYEKSSKMGGVQGFVEILKQMNSLEVEAYERTIESDGTSNQITFYVNGEKKTVQTSQNVRIGVEAYSRRLSESSNILIKASSWMNTTFKKLVTSCNPFFFLVRNPVRDFQDAAFYTKYGYGNLAKNIARAKKEIELNGKFFQEAKAAGLLNSSVYDYEKGIKYKEKRVTDLALEKIEAMSSAIEMTPRLAEYISSREAGNSVDKALLDAADLTTNFGRSGTWGKFLNSTFIPFLNPAIQGMDKLVRTVTSGKSAKAIVNLLAKALVMGVGLSALNDLMNEDDEDYQALGDHVKRQNYVFAIGDGKFVKLPKGRVNGLIGEIYLRGKDHMGGNEKAWADYAGSIIDQVTPVNNFRRSILSPVEDVINNVSWYGKPIDGKNFDNVKPRDRYDENTSSIAIAIGKTLDYSPNKIHYLLDSYGGIISDILLPATSLAAEGSIVEKNLAVNVINNSKWSNSFYNKYELLTYAKADGDECSELLLSYMNKVKSGANGLYKAKREIQASSMSQKEKLAQSNAIQLSINASFKQALEDLVFLEQELKLTEGEINKEKRLLDAISVVKGADTALKMYNKDVYAKAVSLNKIGVKFSDYYDFYFSTKNLEAIKDKEGSAILGSKRKATLNIVNKMAIEPIHKLVLLMSKGYSINEGDIKGVSAVNIKKLANAIAKSKLSLEEKKEVSLACGLKLKGNKIVLK